MIAQSAVRSPLGWIGIVRLGLVQTALGGIVVLTTSTLNRVMVVELALPALLPGLLVALHYSVQVLRPRWGYGSDVGGRCTPWIIGGMAMLAAGGFAAAVATLLMATNVVLGVVVATGAFLIIGVGVGASGTSLLVLLAKRVAPERRAAAATIVWVMMIAGFIVTTVAAGSFLDPYSHLRLVAVSGTVSLIAFAVACVAVAGIEGRGASGTVAAANGAAKTPFRKALAEVWAEPRARQFTIFVFVSMLAYSAQDLILEPFSGAIFAYTPGQSTKLSGVQHSGVLAGMVMVGLATTVFRRWIRLPLSTWTIGGCLASAAALAALSATAYLGPSAPLTTIVFLLGLANGTFAVAAIGSMMALAGHGRQSREGVRMGLWGAAQAIAFGLGGLLGAVSVDLMKLIVGTPLSAYAIVFAAEGCLFVVAALLAAQVGNIALVGGGGEAQPRVTDIGETMLPAGIGERR